MERKQLREKKWFSGTVTACIAIAFYVILTNLRAVGSALGTFIGYFEAVILGGVLAYLMNPLANWFSRKPLRILPKEKTRWIAAVTLAVLTAVLALLILMGMLIPQLVFSIAGFAENFDQYAQTLEYWIKSGPLASLIGAERLQELAENAFATVSDFVSENAGKLLSNVAGAGKNVLTWSLAMILSIYFLAAKDSVKAGAKHLLYAFLPQKRAAGLTAVLTRCDDILVRYLMQSLFESVIVGVLNAVFMAICRMPYIGMISVVVGVTNLVPNFGPLIGGVIGAFILVLVDPMKALVFILFTCVLQVFDGYILKPKLFGGSLGVSGLLILIAGIVFGNIFGIVGVLLSIPAAAILSFLYQDYLIPAVDARAKQTEAEK